MKKIFTSILILGLCTFLSGQNVLNVVGVISNVDGSPAEGIFVSLVASENDEVLSVETSGDGSYVFALDLEDYNAQGCFDLFFLDCTFEFTSINDCYSPENYDFVQDFIYCENGSDGCSVLVFVEIEDSSYILSTWDFGVSPFTYVWEDGSTESTLTIPFGEEDEYCVTVTDSQGCETSGCLDLLPPDPCFVYIYYEYGYNSIQLFAEGYGQTDGLEYLWSTSETTQSITITESGDYCVTITDGLGCESYDCGYFEVDTTGYEECYSYIYSTYDGDVETLNAESFGIAPFTYVWNFGDEVVSTSQSLVPEEVGIYCVTVTDAEGCESTDCYEYFIWEDCGVWVSCDPIDEGVLLWGLGYGIEPIEYSWANGDEGQELFVTESGEYCLTITDAEGCSSSSCITVNVEAVSECFAPIEVLEFDDYTQLTINPITDGEYEYTWSTGELTSSINVEESGVYCVDVLEVETGCYFYTCETVIIGGQEDCWGYIYSEYNGDSTAVLTAVAYDMMNDSLGFQYEWSTGADTESIEVTEAGDYCVTIYGSDDCVIETCETVVFWEFPWLNSIIGFVYDSANGSFLNATIDIYSVLDNGAVELYSEGNETFEDGFYAIADVDPGNYIALAVVSGGEYVPTYGFSTSSWEEADVFEVGNNTIVPPVEISMIPISDIAGIGTIQGVVSTDKLVADEKESDARVGTPIEGANIMLMHTEVPVGQLFTDNDGNFYFTGLPFGTYNVVLEIPGFPRKILEVTLSEENPFITDVDFETDFAVTSTNYVTSMSSLTLSPNPTSNTLVVDTYFTEAKDITYSVIDINGRIIKFSAFEAVQGKNIIQLDVSSMNNGIYNLVIQSNEELIAKKFIKL